MVVVCVSPYEKNCFIEFDETAQVEQFLDLKEFINYFAVHKNRDLVLIYHVKTIDEVQMLEQLSFSNNIYIIVIGENDLESSLLAGRLGVDIYLNKDEVSTPKIMEYIEASQTVIKHRKGSSNISVFTGISGGVGTTTISMNLVKTLSDEHPEKNILYLDFSDTKAVSNLFFEVIHPPKTIIDITGIQSTDLEELFKNGLIKLNHNLYFIPGIQRHTDKEELSRSDNLQIYLTFITQVKEFFDFIIIDIGVFKDQDLEVDIQELADDIFVITELDIPSLSILKTYLDIIDKSGWYNKVNIIANRLDTFGSMTKDETERIISKGLKNEFEVAHSFPNDALNLRECWNEAKLVCDVFPESSFMESLHQFIKKYYTAEEAFGVADETKSKSFLSRIKGWL